MPGAPTMTTFPLYTTSFRGIGPITARELQDRFGQALGPLEFFPVRDYDLTCFSFTGAAIELFELGTAEDVFYRLDTMQLSGETEDLQKLQARFQDTLIEPGLALHRQHTVRGNRKRTTFRVVVQARDTAWRRYRRIDLQLALSKAIGHRFPRWYAVDEEADLEFWLQQSEHTLLLGLRLSDRQMRHRTYKVANLPGSLRPTIAYALAYLSGPGPDQVFLDPTCGAGTLLIERARAGRHRLLIGGDLDPEALAHAAENFGPSHRPRGLLRWDAARLPLPDASVDRAAANLPWGRQHGALDTNPALYQATLAEVHRVLKPGGRAVFLTSEFALFRETLKKLAGLYLVEQVRGTAILGQKADIFVVGKTDTGHFSSDLRPRNVNG